MLSRKNLHNYQKDIIEKAKSVPSMGLFLEPGLGKTATTLTIIAEQFKGTTLVIAPKRVAETVWQEETQKWEHLKHLKIEKILGTPSQRLAAIKSSSSVYVVNLENLIWLLNQPSIKFQNLVIDESSRFKDSSTKRFKELKKHLKSFNRRIIMTGTPTPQGYADLWSQVGILDMGQRLETSLTKFRTKYMRPGKRNPHTGVIYNWELNKGADQIITETISDICFSLKAKDYLELPTVTYTLHKVGITEQIRYKYDALKKDMVTEIKGQTVTASTAATLTGKLLQFTSGAVYAEDGSWQEVHTAKLECLESILEETSSPTLVFYHFKHSLERIRNAFPEAVVLTDSNIQAWRDGKIRVLLAHPQSGGIGINLQCNAGETAQTVWYDLPWSSENYIQANARIYRQGQEKPVIIHHLCVEKSVDEQVMKVLDNKITIQDALMEALK
jgi:SNF2 family DNA or RNA helicase